MKSISSIIIGLVLCVAAVGQNKSFIPVEGATLKAKIDSAITSGKANAPGGRFWVGYQFEVRPGVAVDFEVVDSAGGVYVSSDGTSTLMIFDPRRETRELGLFLLFDTQRNTFTRAEIYNLQRTHEFSNYPVYWAGRIANEESLNYLKSIVVDSPAPEEDRIAERALFAIALHDDARVDPILIDIARRPADPFRSRAIYWLGNTPESPTKNTLFTEIVRNNQESNDVRNTAMSALAMSRSAATLPLLQNLFETMITRELKRRALTGIARNDNSHAAATYLIRVAENDAEIELQKHAVVAIGRLPKDEAIPILIRTARSHPKMAIRKLAIQALGQTGDERAVAFFRELLSKD